MSEVIEVTSAPSNDYARFWDGDDWHIVRFNPFHPTDPYPVHDEPHQRGHFDPSHCPTCAEQITWSEAWDEIQRALEEKEIAAALLVNAPKTTEVLERRGVPKLPTDWQARKDLPIATGVLDYFPLALAEVARVSAAGSRQHHPTEPLHWDKAKSTDHADCLVRHFLERGTRDTDGERHSAKVAWRALALLEIELENERDAQS